MPRDPRPRLAPADALKREIQAVLRADDGGLANERYAGGDGRFDGYGYVAAEAYWHLSGGRESALRPMQHTHRGQSGTPRPFRGTKAGISNGARRIVEAVLAARG